jgi:hypothetical protein
LPKAVAAGGAERRIGLGAGGAGAGSEMFKGGSKLRAGLAALLTVKLLIRDLLRHIRFFFFD